MKITIQCPTKKLWYFIISLLLIITIFFGCLGIVHYEATKGIGNDVSANSNLYQEVRRNDLHYLHKVGNRKAKLANAQAYRLNFTQNKTSRKNGDIKSDYTGKYPIYHHDKHGNYWSYFEDHQAVMNDVPNAYNSGSDDTISAQTSGIIANEKVLRNHGVHSGVNFEYTTE